MVRSGAVVLLLLLAGCGPAALAAIIGGAGAAGALGAGGGGRSSPPAPVPTGPAPAVTLAIEVDPDANYFGRGRLTISVVDSSGNVVAEPSPGRYVTLATDGPDDARLLQGGDPSLWTRDGGVVSFGVDLATVGTYHFRATAEGLAPGEVTFTVHVPTSGWYRTKQLQDDVRAVAIRGASGEVLCAATDYELFRATDGPGSFVPVWPNLDRSTKWGASTLVVAPGDPLRVYAGSSSWFQRSIDGGCTWSLHGLPIAGGGMTSFDSSSVAVDPADPLHVFAAGYQGVLASTDGGDTWAVVSSRTDVISLATSPQATGLLYAGTSRGDAEALLRSSDRGATWTGVGSALSGYAVHAIAVDPVTSGTVYVCGEHLYGSWGNAFKTTDGGTTWTPLATGLTRTLSGPACVAVDPSAPSTVYFGGYAEVARTTDAGATFVLLDAGLAPALGVAGIAIDPARPRRILLAAQMGIYETTTGGE